MFTKVLIVEDHQSIKDTVARAVTALAIPDPPYAYYCDDALLHLKKELKNDQPVELLITDLSFVEDGRTQQLPDGGALIFAARQLQPDLKILVFSSESNMAVVGSLFNNLAINGYVFKGRRDTLDLKEAITAIYKGKKYVSAEFQQAIRQKNTYDFDDTELLIIKQLAQGTLQKNIPDHLQQLGIRASSLSSIEKRLKHIRETLGFSTNEQLIAHCKDYRVI